MSVLYDLKSATAKEISMLLEKDIYTVSNLLLHYYRQNLVHRYYDYDEKSYVYYLSNKGLRRLAFLETKLY